MFIKFKFIGTKKAVQVFRRAESSLISELRDIVADVVRHEMHQDAIENVQTRLSKTKNPTKLLKANIRPFVKIMGKVIIAGLGVDLNRVPYARIHEFGGVTHPTVTKKSKKFFWYKFFSGGEAEEKWKRMALAKVGKKFTVKIPATHYLGNAIEKNIPLLRKRIQEQLKNLGERK